MDELDMTLARIERDRLEAEYEALAANLEEIEDRLTRTEASSGREALRPELHGLSVRIEGLRNEVQASIDRVDE